MKYTIIILFVFFILGGFSQTDSLLIKPGKQAPSFILNVQANTIQSFTMPYMRKIVLLHFWSSNVKKSRVVNRYLNRLSDRYKNAQYRNADGFEILSIAVQTDKNAWKEAITLDTLVNFTHGIAIRGYNDEVCKKYGVTSLPTDVLIDDQGLVIAVNPTMTELENILDDRKNIQPIKKDIVGTLARPNSSLTVASVITRSLTGITFKLVTWN